MLRLTPEDRRKLELAGLIKPGTQVSVSSGKAPNVLLVRPPKVTHIIAPVAAGTKAKRVYAMTVQECRDQNICQYCRVTPAKYFGPGIGYAAGCPRCTVENAAKTMRRQHGR